MIKSLGLDLSWRTVTKADFQFLTNCVLPIPIPRGQDWQAEKNVVYPRNAFDAMVRYMIKFWRHKAEFLAKLSPIELHQVSEVGRSITTIKEAGLILERDELWLFSTFTNESRHDTKNKFESVARLMAHQLQWQLDKGSWNDAR